MQRLMGSGFCSCTGEVVVFIWLASNQKNLLKAGWVKTNGLNNRLFVPRERESLRRKLVL